MKNPYNFLEYEIIKEKNESHLLFKLFLILFFIGIIIIICKFKFQIYEKYMLLNSTNNYMMIVNVEEINEIENNNKLQINNKNYKYNISLIDKEYSNINGTLFQTVYLDIDLNTDASYVYGYLLKSDNTLLDMLIEFIRGGK